MKRTRFGVFWATVLVALLAAAPALAGWTVMHAGPESYDLEAVWGWAGAPSAEAVGVDTGYTKMLRYAGGLDFTDDTPGSPWAYPLHGVWGAADDDIWAVGDKILHYDGSWTEDAFPLAAPLNAVWGRSASDVFAVGDGGLIVHYDGTSWSPMSFVPTSQDLYDVFGDAGVVKAVGAGGTILSYNGSVWDLETSPTTKDLYGVWIGGVRGFAVGEGGTLLRYIPALNKWVAVAPKTAKNLYDVFGVNGGSEVWAVGAAGKIIHFSAGVGWTTELSVTSEDLWGVWGLTSGPDVFAVGDAGVILRRETTGQPYGLDAIYPENTPPATGVHMRPRLKWKGYTDTAGAKLAYKVYLDTDIVHEVWPPVASGVTCKWKIPMKYALAPNTVHHWQVQAKDTKSKLITLSEWWDFETGTYPWLGPPTPKVARPSYLVWLEGANLGSGQGAVKIRYYAVVDYTGDEPVYGWVTRWVDGDFGKIVGWTNTQVVIQLAPALYWSNLPQTVKIKVRPRGSSTWSNTALLKVEWGGGGWTGY